VIAAARHAATVMLGCLLNLDAVIQALRSPDGEPQAVQFACSGTDCAIALEDAYVAGRLCARLEGPRTDAARVAEAVARAYPSPLEALAASADAIALRSAGLAADIADCARVSTLDVVPRVITSIPGVAVAVSDTAELPEAAGGRPVDTGYTVGV
jgi:phosphosulfolactate phosphohydrolase-like enzyme